MRDYVNDGKPFIVSIKNPTYFVPAVDAAAGLTTAVEQSGWMDTGASAIPYRGFFILVENANSAFGGGLNQRVFTQRVTATIEFRGVR